MILSSFLSGKHRFRRFSELQVCGKNTIEFRSDKTFYPYLNFEEFKRSLGKEAENTADVEIEELRTSGYKLADVVFEQWFRKHNGAAAKSPRPC